MCGTEGMQGRGPYVVGACMAGGDVHGRGHAWGHAWQ